MFSTNCLPFSFNLKLSSANSLSLEESKTCRLGKGYRIQDTYSIETIMEKGEIAHFEQFHIFPQCFPEAFFFTVLK